ncbi:hypothetical protein JYK22_25110, partial [Nonomuraea sp. RK-328]|nr:hypothetical protein [Nonomuraea sp. RK-328]
VVPGDQAAGRVPDPVVRAERLFQEAQEAKRRASDALPDGDATTAENILLAAGDALEEVLAWAPNAEELADGVKELRRYARDAWRDGNRISKMTRASWYSSTRKRGRPSSRRDQD